MIEPYIVYGLLALGFAALDTYVARNSKSKIGKSWGVVVLILLIAMLINRMGWIS